MTAVTNCTLPDDPYATITVSPSGLAVASPFFPFLAPPRFSDELGWLGGYRVLRLLGEGGMGMVFEAQDPKLNRRVALKVMKPEQAARPSCRQRFLREAQAVAALEHDHVVAIFQVGEDRGVAFLTMPFLCGECLEARLQRDTTLPIDDALRIGREVASGLAAAHARRLVHRDIKPGNIWLESGRARPRAKILDFGLARAIECPMQLTQTGALLGTPAYMAPEQRLDARLADARSDLWSLAATLHHMLTGRPPCEIGSEVVPEALRPALAKALCDDPDGRYASADDFALALRAIESELDLAVERAVPGSLASYLKEKRRIESLLDQSRYSEAIFRLELLAGDERARPGGYKTWAAHTLGTVRKDYLRMRTQARAVRVAGRG